MRIKHLQQEKVENAEILQQSTALSLLAQYTDSEDELDNNDTSEGIKSQYRQAESSDSSSSSSSDEEITIKVIKKKLEVPASDDDSENENGESSKERKKKPPLRVKGELLLVS